MQFVFRFLVKMAVTKVDVVIMVMYEGAAEKEK